jgi:hypothetical protein
MLIRGVVPVMFVLAGDLDELLPQVDPDPARG